MKPLLVLQTGQAPRPIRARLGDFPHWFRLGLGVAPDAVRVVDVAGGQTVPRVSAVGAVVVTGSAAMVTERAGWSEHAAEWIRQAFAENVPMLGVCYGHQLMAHALGGTVGWLPGGREIGTKTIQRMDLSQPDRLLEGLPEQFMAHTTHAQAVLEPPRGTRVLARTAQDPHHVLRYSEHAASVQFHPEFSVAAMRAYLRLRATELASEGLNVNELVSDTRAAPVARRLLRRFARMALGASPVAGTTLAPATGRI